MKTALLLAALLLVPQLVRSAAPANVSGLVITWSESAAPSFFHASVIDEASQRVGAFPLATGDRAVVLTLQAGAHTMEVSAADPGLSGEVLVEVYQLP